MKFVSAAFMFTVAIGSAHAQQAGRLDISSSVDNASANNRGKIAARFQSPGTVGAMSGAADGIAANSAEVLLQQRGRHLMAYQGTEVRLGPQETISQSPGTVGSAPGYSRDEAQPIK